MYGLSLLRGVFVGFPDFRWLWLTPELLHEIIIRNNLFEIFLRTMEPDFRIVYKQYKIHLNIEMGKEKNRYYSNVFSEETLRKGNDRWKKMKNSVTSSQ